MSVKKYAIFLCAAYAATQLLTGCGSEEAQQPAENNKSQNASCCDLSKTKDGTYTAESSVDKVHGKAVITLTIKDHKITAVEYKGIDKDGTTVKDENYGNDKDPTNAKKAKVAYESQRKYADQLLQKQKLGKVDAISGATINYDQFVEAVKKDLEQANQ